MSASFTEQLSCPKRIFVLFMQIATENDVTSAIASISVCGMLDLKIMEGAVDGDIYCDFVEKFCFLS